MHTKDVDVKPVLELFLRNSFDDSVLTKARIVDQHISATLLRDKPVDDFVHFSCVGHVQMQDTRASFFEIAHFVGAPGRSVNDMALGKQLLRREVANPSDAPVMSMT